MTQLWAPVQIAYAVPDAAAAAQQWVSEQGAGPFFLRTHIELADVMYRGRPATFDHTSAYGQWGAVMVELVQDHTDGPSVIGDVFAPGESGLHHLAFVVDDLDATVRTLAERGHELAMSARTAGGTVFHFVDALATHGHFFELYQRTDRLLGFYAMVADAARDWNGREPVRVM
jgi:predicted enzyme related to lactoylglutathione lyase